MKNQNSGPTGEEKFLQLSTSSPTLQRSLNSLKVWGRIFTMFENKLEYQTVNQRPGMIISRRKNQAHGFLIRFFHLKFEEKFRALYAQRNLRS